MVKFSAKSIIHQFLTPVGKFSHLLVCLASVPVRRIFFPLLHSGRAHMRARARQSTKQGLVRRLTSHIVIHSGPHRPRSFWSAPIIGTSGKVQHRKSTIHGLPVTLRMYRVKSDKSDWLRERNEFSAHVQRIGPGQRLRFMVLTKRSAASGDENDRYCLRGWYTKKTLEAWPSRKIHHRQGWACPRSTGQVNHTHAKNGKSTMLKTSTAKADKSTADNSDVSARTMAGTLSFKCMNGMVPRNLSSRFI